MFVNLDAIFEKNITELNFYINKFNFFNYTIPINNSNNQDITNSIDLFSIPSKYIEIFYNILIYNKNTPNLFSILQHELSKRINKSNVEILIDDIFIDGIDNKYVKYLKNMTNINNNEGFLFNNNYINEVCYTNKYCKFIKSISNSYYFKKIYTNNQCSWCWCGLYLNDCEESGVEQYAKISFDIKILKKIKNGTSNNDWGLKTHYPLAYYNNWMNKCIVDEFVYISFSVKINRTSQYLILNFDNYNDEIEFIINNFKIKLNYIKNI